MKTDEPQGSVDSTSTLSAMLAWLKASLFGFPRSEEVLCLVNRTFGDARVEVLSVYDGDTFTASIRDYPPIVGEKIPVRVHGIDCPELHDPRPKVKALAQKARDLARARLMQGGEVLLRQMRRDKYFRLLAEVWVDGANLADQLLAAGLARPYLGGTKTPW